MDNYAIMLERARQLFLTWDQEKMIARCKLRFDEAYLYLSFLGEPWRVDRRSGGVQCIRGAVKNASFSQGLSIYDYLCRQEELPALTGRFCPANSLPHVAQSNPDTIALHRPYAAYMQAHLPALKQALASSFQPYPKGDAACVFPVFDGFEAVFQFWEGDEDFLPSLIFLWDECCLSYLRYETLYYVMDCFIELLKGKIAQFEAETPQKNK